MSDKKRQTFEAPDELDASLRVNHASETELWGAHFEEGHRPATASRGRTM